MRAGNTGKENHWKTNPEMHVCCFYIPAETSEAILRLQIVVSYTRNLSVIASCTISQRKQATIHQVATMPATSKNVLFPGYN